MVQIKKLTYRDRTALALSRNGEKSFTEKSFIMKAKVHARKKGDKLGPRPDGYFTTEIRMLAAQGVLNYDENRDKYKPTPETQSMLRETERSPEEDEVLTQHEYLAEAGRLRQTLPPTPRKTKAAILQEQIKLRGKYMRTESENRELRGENDVLRLENDGFRSRLEQGRDAPLPGLMCNVPSSLAPGPSNIPWPTPGDDERNPFLSPVRPHRGASAYPSPVSNKRRPFGREPAQIVSPASPSPCPGPLHVQDYQMDLGEGPSGSSHDAAQALIPAQVSPAPMLELRAKDEQITQLEADVGVLRHQLADAQACAKAAGERNAGLEHQVEELQRQVERKSKALQDLVAFKESTKGLFAALQAAEAHV